MRSRIRIVSNFLFVALAAALSACGSSGSSSSTAPAGLRVINATRSATLAVSLNGTSEFSSIAPASASSSASIAAGTNTLTIATAGGTLTSVTETVGLSSATSYSLLVYESQGALHASLFTENQSAPLSGYGSLTVDNLSPDAGALDMYVVAPGTSTLTGLAPTFPYSSGATATTTLVAGSYDVIATAAGNRNDVRFKLASLAIAGGQVQTLVFTSTIGGALVNGIVFTQGGSVQFDPATNARIRVVSALPVTAAAPVAATIESTPLAAVYAPNPGVYSLVAGDANTYSISVAGAPVANLPATMFAAGGDFTILVYGTTSSPLVAVFTDDNHQPSGGQVSLRLVNAAVNAASGLTLYDNNVVVATGVGYGAASGYVGETASSTSQLQIVEPSVPPVTDTVALASASVYTLFVLDSSLTPYIIRDR